jgi:bisanhydrobacterioruberin hydratase
LKNTLNVSQKIKLNLQQKTFILQQKKEVYATYSLILFYLVGITGFIIPGTWPFFSSLIPLALLLNAGFLYFFHQPGFNLKTSVVFLAIFIASFFAEVIGVHTGMLFGEYIYGKGLGPKIMETPLIIGLNWLMLVYCTKVMADEISSDGTVKLFLGPTLMTGYDLLLEQAAPLLGMWRWAGETVPVQNYIAWFLLAFLFHLLIRKINVDFKNPLASPVFIIQFLFFVLFVAFFTLNKS